MRYVVMALQDYFHISDFDARRDHAGNRTAPYSAEKVLALRNFKNDFIVYEQTGPDGNSDLRFVKIGLDRPFRQIYFDISREYTLPGVGRSGWFYSDGPGYPFPQFTEAQIDDETGIIRQSGLLKLREIPSNWAKDGDGLYSIFLWCTRANPTAGDVRWEIPIRGINYIFSDDHDLERIRSDIMEASQGKGWGPKHVLARDFIMQQVRRKFDKKDLSAFDIVNPWELRETSTFLAMSFIYKYELSKLNGDIFDTQSKSFYEKAKKSFDEYVLSIDTNRDGKVDADDAVLVGDDMVNSIGLEWT